MPPHVKCCTPPSRDKGPANQTTHNNLLARQYLLSCQLPTHPSNEIVSAPAAPRNIKKGLVRTYPEVIAKVAPDGYTGQTYKRHLGELHEDAVRDVLSSYPQNVVLGSKPPAIHKSEADLPRQTRTTLAQLRSGWCRSLNSYMSRLDPTIDNVCPKCGNGPHDTAHLFQCPANHTELIVTNLWTKPMAAAVFLDLETAETLEDDRR